MRNNAANKSKVEESLSDTERRNASRASKISAGLIQAAAALHTLQRDLQRMADTTIRLKLRQSTREQIEQATWRIHYQAREGRDSMDSERHAGFIRDTIERAIIDATRRAERAEIESNRQKTERARRD